MSGDVVERAKAALEGVTAGPWEWAWHVNPIDDDELHGPRWEHIVGTQGSVGDADARFIAAARSLVPELVAEVERLRGALADVAIDQYMREHGYAGIKSAARPHHPQCGQLSVPDTAVFCQRCGGETRWCGCTYRCPTCEAGQ